MADKSESRGDRMSGGWRAHGMQLVQYHADDRKRGLESGEFRGHCGLEHRDVAHKLASAHGLARDAHT